MSRQYKMCDRNPSSQCCGCDNCKYEDDVYQGKEYRIKYGNSVFDVLIFRPGMILPKLKLWLQIKWLEFRLFLRAPYNNDQGKKKGFYLIRSKPVYLYVNGAYCFLEVQFGNRKGYRYFQFGCRDKWFNTDSYTYVEYLKD